MQSDSPKTSLTYIVTGTTRGIGRALADEIINRGYRLFSLSRSPDGRSGPHRNFHCDLSQPDQVRGVMDRLIKTVDTADCNELVLINNAGILDPIRPLEKIRDDEILVHLNTNLIAPTQLISQFVSTTPDSIASRRIINITSGAAHHAYAGWSLYCASKVALNMITACVDLELKGASSPVHICAVAPGVVDTDMQRQIRDARPEHFPMQQRFVKMQTEGNLSRPEKVAGMILDLDLSGQFVSGGIYDLRHVSWEEGIPRIAPVSV
jgi:benzil reductase ((S)-benzoin forming)